MKLLTWNSCYRCRKHFIKKFENIWRDDKHFCNDFCWIKWKKKNNLMWDFGEPEVIIVEPKELRQKSILDF